MIDYSEQLIESDDGLTPASRQAVRADLDQRIAEYLATGGVVTVVGQLQLETESTSAQKKAPPAKKRSDQLLRADLEIKAKLGKNLHEAATELVETISRCQRLARAYKIPFRSISTKRGRGAC